MKKTEKLVLTGVLTAIVFVLQLMAPAIKIGTFSFTLVLVPVIIGAALCGVSEGTWLGFVFGLSVLTSGDAAAFMSISTIGAILTVMVKGTLAGFFAGFVYKFLENKNKTAAVFTSAVICPVVNTGIFILGTYIFFLDTVAAWGKAVGIENSTVYIFTGLIGANFFVELAVNLILAPVIVKIITLGFRTFKKTTA